MVFPPLPRQLRSNEHTNNFQNAGRGLSAWIQDLMWDRMTNTISWRFGVTGKVVGRQDSRGKMDFRVYPTHLCHPQRAHSKGNLSGGGPSLGLRQPGCRIQILWASKLLYSPYFKELKFTDLLPPVGCRDPRRWYYNAYRHNTCILKLKLRGSKCLKAETRLEFLNLSFQDFGERTRI